jgi:hypothetical protein
MTTTGTTGRRRGRTVAAVTAAMAAFLAAAAWQTSAAGPARIDGPASAGALATRITASAPPSTAPPVTPVAPGTHFGTLPPGAALPSDAACAAAVRPAAELRPDNATANATRGTDPHDTYPRVTGAYTGTTDEILQWVACKWGIDEDIVRAQIAKESSWHQSVGGDLTTDQQLCHPAKRTGSGTCPESIGLGQVRYQYHGEAFEDENAIRSSAYNVDYTYAVWRSCYEGELGWLNTVDRGATYVAGDVWGCLGVWFSGRWRTSPALTYIAAVQQYLADRIWEQAYFRTW